MIGFNKPYLTGQEMENMREAVRREKLSGNGYFTKKSHEFFKTRYGLKKTLLTQSATAALEMIALLINIQPGDEVIMPSYTFVSTANAFVLRGAHVVFADSNNKNPNIDPDSIQTLITPRTVAIVVVHYAGMACDMDRIMAIALKHDLFVVEDAAQAIDSFYNDRPLGSIGHFAAFSFHETKNIIAGEGGMLAINDARFMDRAEIIWEKGTNRSAFFRGEVDKYNWVDIGSSFLPSEITAAFLYAQLERLDDIQNMRKKVWQQYYNGLQGNNTCFEIPHTDTFATNNAHIFYLVTKDAAMRDALIAHLKEYDIQAIFHYIPLHTSPFITRETQNIVSLPQAERYGECLVRLPLYAEMTTAQADYVIDRLLAFTSK